VGARPGVLLEDLGWLEAEKLLTPDAVVVLPIGAAAKEHGPHLKLNNDLRIARYFEERVRERARVVVAPAVSYHHYPAFVEYPGSTTLRLETARDLVVDVCRSLAAHGPRRFYALNTGISTVRALEPAAELLRADGVLLTFTRLDRGEHARVRAEVSRQEGGTHADEIETSMMLVIAPESVDMRRAVKDYDARNLPGLSRRPDAGKSYSPSGVFGDATLATVDKGRRLVEAMLAGILADIEALRAASLPEPSPSGPPGATPSAMPSASGTASSRAP
jgi:creatinine amidohydrolase